MRIARRMQIDSVIERICKRIVDVFNDGTIIPSTECTIMFGLALEEPNASTALR